MDPGKTVTDIRILPKEGVDFDASRHRERRELVLVYLGRPSCGFCQDPAYRLLLQEAKERLAEKARALRMPLRTIGVSAGRSVAEGVVFLEEAGAWHEIIVGSDWSNSGVIEHVWSVAEAKGRVPQVVVFERTVQHGPQGLSFPAKRYLVRLVGKGPLQQWLEAGLPVEGEAP
jgi:hypothetical protein